MESTSVAPLLWICTLLLVGRVAGQLVVVLLAPRWLPPMERWQSGLVPYWFLLASQTVVVWLMVWISIDFSRGSGYWVEPRVWAGPAAYYWSYAYAGAMVVRYAIRMSTHPGERWFGGTIPIVFHTVVAVFQWGFGVYQVSS
jgi:hypothetical protein